MRFFDRLGQELGWGEFTHSASRRDIGLSYASRLIRLFGFGLVAPILIIYLNISLNISNRSIGFFLTLTLWGDVILSLLVTWLADKMGRRNTLAVGSLFMAISGVVFATSSSFFVLLGAAMIGVISRESSSPSVLPLGLLLTIPPCRFICYLVFHSQRQ